MTQPGISDAARQTAEHHITEHVEGEAARIEKLSRVRELILGFQDGLLVPLGVVSGMAAAHPARSVIMVAGLAEAVAGSIAMGGGAYLASEAEERLYHSEIESERQEIIEEPERETAELALILEREGLERPMAEQVALGLASHPEVFLRTKVQKELNLSPDVGGAAFGDAMVVGGSYAVAAVVPLWPYATLPLGTTALVVSILCTLVALFILGVVKARVASQKWWFGGFQVMVIGGASAGVGYLIGHLITALAG
ncbi:MAG: VIT1/CCC1 transporter family protein [Thermoleophilia bacterium]